MNVYSLILISLSLTLMACGPRGRQGDAGAQGVPGVAAPAVAIVTGPASALQCPSGGTVVSIDSSQVVVCNGASGTDGSNGVDGTDGQNGQNGQDGAAGTVITMVKFCPGTASYPSTFPEYGIKIGTQVYAVYSQNGGFLALIPAGTYSSNGINSSCNFTVGADGSITSN